MTPSLVVLVGFMGTGKTTVGRRLAERLGLAFADMDAVIAERAGKPIAQLFAEEGEPAFRRREHALVRELAIRRGLVVAAGGGVVLNQDNLRDFSAAGCLVCLRAEPEELLRRLAADTDRPLLAHPDREDRLRALLRARQPLYDAIPIQVETTGRTVNEVVDAIVQRLGAAP